MGYSLALGPYGGTIYGKINQMPRASVREASCSVLTRVLQLLSNVHITLQYAKKPDVPVSGHLCPPGTHQRPQVHYRKLV